MPLSLPAGPAPTIHLVNVVDVQLLVLLEVTLHLLAGGRHGLDGAHGVLD